jgi:digeranylgeranylglycerophospholipid reductase
MIAEMVDVLVVGLGPAGARAAEAVARSGRSVFAIDRKQRAGFPVQCAEFIPALLTQELEALERVTLQPITRMVTVVEDSKPDVKLDFPGRMIDRCRFDAALVAKAEQAGAICRFGVEMEMLDDTGAAKLSDGSLLRANVVIGADGPRSRVGKAIGKVNKELVETRQMNVPLLKAHDATDIFLSAGIPGGYGWLFPKGDMANLGVGVVEDSKRKLKPLLEGLREDFLAEGRIGEAILGHTGGLIPVGGPIGAIGTLGQVQVVLAGDAAGLSNPITGAGISAASISGELAGDAAVGWLDGDPDTLDDYVNELLDLFGLALKHARQRREEILVQYERDNAPSVADLRQSWIAYPEYWAA